MEENKRKVEIDNLPLGRHGGIKVEIAPILSTDNPWRTLGDYKKEQKRDTVRFYITLITLFVAIASVITTTVIARATMRSIPSPVIAEGVLFSVEYQLEDGRTGGFTRLNSANAVPGGNGSWNVDAYGRLMEEYLIITYPQKKEIGPHVIPARRLVNVQFSGRGIKKVDESKPAAPK